jgi:CheY-like chemotaxis protein
VVTKTILIVDDQRLVVEVLDVLFGNEGYLTLAAQIGVEALTVLARARPDVIVTDLWMPVLDGFGFCRAVLADLTTATIPLVLMSAAPDLKLSIDFPIAGFIVKPFQFEMVLSLIAALIGEPRTAGTS